MNTKSKNLKKLGPILSGFLIWILVFSIGVFVAYTLYKIEIKGHLIETQNTLIIIKDSVQRSIGEINKATDIYTSSITEYEGDSDKKNSFTEHLLNTYEGIKLIRIDLEGETKHIYSIGGDIEDFSNEQIFKTALELAKSDSIFVSGLYNFEGVTSSVLICTPFQNKYNEPKGVITAVIDLKILLENSDITSFSELYYLQISNCASIVLF